MPRLVGQRSNGGLYLGLTVAIAVVAATMVEYIGVIDWVPGFGRDPIEWNSKKDISLDPQTF
jgi:hypothetical protein